MNKTSLLLIGVFSILFNFVNAQVATPFKERFSQSLGGNMTMIANNMVSRTAITDYNGEDNNNVAPSVYVDIDNDDTTFNSSSATFNNPELTEPCIAILNAFLYWSAADAPAGIFGNQDNQPDWDFNDIKLMLPGETTYTTLTADEIIFRDRDDVNNNFNNQPYVCVKDISEEVIKLQQNIYGRYQVANVEAKIGDLGSTGTSAGWQIVFIYSSPELPVRNITLFDGYAHIESALGTLNEVDIDFNGFITVPNGPVKGNVAIGALEGDRQLIGDQLQIKNIAGNFVDLIAPLRATDNFFNSRITLGLDNFIDRNPASTNTLGFDAALFELNNPNNTILNNESTATTLKITSNQEVYGIYMLGLSVEVTQPNLYPIISQRTGTNPANYGDIIGLNINITNTGMDDAVNSSFVSQLPNQVELIEPIILPTGINYTYNSSTNELVFNLEDGFLNQGSPSLNIDLDVKIKEECFFIEENCNLYIQFKLETFFNGTANPDNPLITISNIDPNTCYESPFIINVNQPEINWMTSLNELDRVYSCDNLDGITEAQLLSPIIDKCGLPLLVKTSGIFTPNPSSPGTGTYTNTWNFPDTCSILIIDYVQTITTTDNIAPTANDLDAITVSCITDFPPNTDAVIDISDNCSVPTVSFVSDISNGSSCSETITRTYSVTDAHNNSISINQIITVIDDEAPTADNTNPITISCTDTIPPPDINIVTNVQDNCSIPNVAFVSETIDGTTCPYTITRSYSVTDACSNATYVDHKITVSEELSVENNTHNSISYSINSKKIFIIKSIDAIENVSVYNMLGQELFSRRLNKELNHYGLKVHRFGFVT